MISKALRRRGIFICFFWALNICLLLIPSGLLNRKINALRSQWKIEEMAESKSPYKQLCHFCDNPATYSRAYNRGLKSVTLYFCSQHDAPEQVSSRSGHFGSTLFELMLIAFLIFFYGSHTFASINYFGSKEETSIGIALIGLVLALGALFWDNITGFF